mgnify:CR=1 FL=1
MIPLVLFLLVCAAVYVGTVEAAFTALMRLPLRLSAERHGRLDRLGYLDDPLQLFVPVRLLQGFVVAVVAGACEAAAALLDEAGWTDSDGDGIRDKDGMKLSLLYQSSTNAVRQDFQALIKQWWSEIGVETELRNVDSSVFFGGDPGSPDTFQKFYADVEMYANNFDGTDPQSYLQMYRCGNEPKPSSQWQGENINRFCNEEYDALLDELAKTGELEKRGEIAKKLNDIITKETMTIVPLVDRGRVSAHSNSLGGVVLNTWDSELWNAADWYRIDG